MCDFSLHFHVKLVPFREGFAEIINARTCSCKVPDIFLSDFNQICILSTEFQN